MNWDGWDIALYVSSGYVAVRVLVWMMAAKRDGLLERFREQMQRRKEAEERKKKEKEKRLRRPWRRADDEDEAKAA